MIQTNAHNQGLALILTLVTVSAIITITISMIGLTLQQLQLSVDARDSERAFHAASAGLECGQFVRDRESSSFLAYTPGDGDPDIAMSCMDETDSSDGVDVTPSDGSSGAIKQFSYEIEPTFSGRNTCVQIDIAIMESPINSSMSHDFAGQIGVVGCVQSSVCTVVISRGYNRTCGAAVGGTYEVLRELNAIY